MAKDYTTSNNPHFLYFAELHQPLPAWVAASPTPTAAAFEKCASVAFADPSRRLLPIRDKISTFHSALDLFSNVENYSSDVFDRVKSACAYYGIEKDVAPYADIFADKIEKSAAHNEFPEGRFAINQHINGSDYKLLPLNDAADVRDSAHELAKMAAENRIHFVTMVPAAVEIVKAASDYGVTNIPAIIQRFGAARCPDLEKAASRIIGREMLAKSANRESLRKDYADAIAEAVAGDISPELCMMKIAAIDDAAGIRCRYDAASPVIPPSEIVFCGPLVSEVEKTAKEHVAVKEVLVPLSVLKSIDWIDYDYKLSKEASRSISGLHATEDAKDLSLAIMEWDDSDQRTLLRMAASA